MKRQQILQTIKDLSKSQRFYGRLLRALTEAEETNSEGYEEFMSGLESQNFSDAVDLVIYLET